MGVERLSVFNIAPELFDDWATKGSRQDDKNLPEMLDLLESVISASFLGSRSSLLVGQGIPSEMRQIGTWPSEFLFIATEGDARKITAMVSATKDALFIASGQYSIPNTMTVNRASLPTVAGEWNARYRR